jgi:thymidylate synthase
MSYVWKADEEHKRILAKILEKGCLDTNPRPHWSDGEPAHTLSINHDMSSYDLSKGELPILTLRNIATKSAIGELLWIYQDQSNNLDLLKEKYNVSWWDAWDVGNRTIGACYGETVRRHDLINKLLGSIKINPDSRYHIINLWQVSDFEDPHGLKPCCFQTNFNVRHGRDGIDYLDMCLYQRSNDHAVAWSINLLQYVVLLYLVARDTGYEPGVFTWFGNNIQIYDRHIPQVRELLRRESIECAPKIWLNPDKKDFYSFTVDDIKIVDYPRDIINEKNPQLKFEVAV